jgi:hypothetical protein
MAQLSGAYATYDDVLRREDLLDIIGDVSPDQNYLTTTLKAREARQTLHEWGDYNTARPTDNTAKTIEGNDASFSDLTKATRPNNITQLFQETFAVTSTEIAVDKVNPKDAYARELNYAMRRIKNKMEYAVLRGTKASGASGVAREMSGVFHYVKANGLATVRASGTSLSETEFNAMEVASWNVTDEYVFDLVLTTGTRKQDISKFTAGNTKNIPATDKRLVNSISVYEGDFGVHEIRAHKDIVTNSVLGVRKENLGLAYLIRPHHVKLAKTGSSEKGMVEAELTVEVFGPRAMVVREGYNLT